MNTIFILKCHDGFIHNDDATLTSFHTIEDALQHAGSLGKRPHSILQVRLPEPKPRDLSDVYDRKIVNIIEQQKIKLANGGPQEEVMLSERDFMTKTNAYRGNEEIWFEKSWNTIAPQLLKAVEFVPAKRGPRTKYYLPA
jgi:hypothetical protein